MGRILPGAECCSALPVPDCGTEDHPCILGIAGVGQPTMLVDVHGPVWGLIAPQLAVWVHGSGVPVALAGGYLSEHASAS